MRKKQTVKGGATKQRPTLRTRVGSGGSSSSPSPSKSAEGGSLGHGLLRRAILGTQLPDPPAVIKVVIPPEDLLRDWIIRFTVLTNGSEGGDPVWNEFYLNYNLEEILKQISEDDVVTNVVMSVAYGAFTNPYQILPAVESDGLILGRLMSHLAKSESGVWSMPLLEILCRISSVYNHLNDFAWRSSRIMARTMFANLVSGDISEDQHSKHLYEFLYDLFFGFGVNTSYVVCQADLDSVQKAQLMQGLIAEGKQSNFLWEFEGFMTKS